MKTRREFLQTSICAGASAMLPFPAEALPADRHDAGQRPNIVFILADDMGFSDIGCYGSEIETPHLDELARAGLRFTDFHNSPRCCPSRAALLTGMYAQQAGMGMMTSDHGTYPYPGYAGDLSESCVTVAEALKSGGYTTLMTGKWHLTPLNVGKHNYPLQRGFDRYYGIINGAASYFDPASLTRDNEPIDVKELGKDYYLTDAIGDHSAQFIDDAAKLGKPFFLYAAFTAGHWPLMAKEELIAKYKGRYAGGWDKLRAERHARQLTSGIVKAEWEITPRDPRVPAWERASFHEWEERRMEVYAAQIDSLDQNVGKIVGKLRELGLLENTMICVMSDNGGNYEEIGRIGPGRPRSASMPEVTKDGLPVIPGNDPSIMPGSATTYASYGIPWGNASNTPFRLYKHFAHEGGVSTPFIVHWPRGLKSTGLTHAIGHEIDFMPTCLEIAGVSYPAKSKAGTTPPPLEGKSLVPVFNGRGLADRSIFWEHEGNHAVREGKWKLVSRFPNSWELYDMEADRTEMHDLAEQYPDRVKKMVADYAEWATRAGVQPWPMPETPQGPERTGTMIAPPYLLHDRL
ncbi:MAG TPA: arylsulfatase [Terracidiphilus sp.]|nr:arylsulfatase [Terracidiphilus sp.]